VVDVDQLVDGLGSPALRSASTSGTSAVKSARIGGGEDFLRVMQDGRGGIHGDRCPWLDARIVPTLGLVIADGNHVIGEDPAEARILQQRGALIGGDR
jgi:hypothetical protein